MESLITAEIFGTELKFYTNSHVFSPGNVDKGTLAMLDVLSADGFDPEDKALDLGCGYGAVGISLARQIGADRVFMSDSEVRAVELASKNAVLNGVDINIIHSNAFLNIREKDFTLILSNPPYHADFSVPKAFIEKGFNRLVVGGKMYMVTKRLEWYKNKLTAIFGGTKVVRQEGYYIFTAEKRREGYANKR